MCAESWEETWLRGELGKSLSHKLTPAIANDRNHFFWFRPETVSESKHGCVQKKTTMEEKEKGHSTYEDHIENIGEKATVYKKTTFGNTVR